MFYDTTAETKGFVVRRNAFVGSKDTLWRFFNDWWAALTIRDNVWETMGSESICRFHGRPTANLVYKYPDRLDQIHADDATEIESQTVTAPRVFGALDRAAFDAFLNGAK